jgi:hypothetical protein
LRLTSIYEDDGGWFGCNVRSVLGDGKEIGFWKQKWIGVVRLRVVYPTCFSKSTQQNGTISEMGTWGNYCWFWKLGWSKNISSLEENVANDLQNLLVHVRPCWVSDDKRRWVAATTSYFTVNSAYLELQNRTIMDSLDDTMIASLNKLWMNNVP